MLLGTIKFSEGERVDGSEKIGEKRKKKRGGILSLRLCFVNDLSGITGDRALAMK